MRLDREVTTQPAENPVRRGFNWRRAGRITLIGTFIVVVIVGALGLGLWKYVNDKFGDTHLSKSQTKALFDPLPDHALNIIVVGSDRRDVVEGSESGAAPFKKEGTGGQRSDTLMVVHINPQGKGAIVVSFPRDLRVHIPGHKAAFEKINAAYNDGPNKVIETVESITGLQINHYVDINFSSFQKIVDAVGGVNMCVRQAYHDRRSGLYISKPGCYKFGGFKALAFVRMRYEDPNGDFGRIDRQQLFMRTLMHRAKQLGVIANPARIISLANAISKGVQTDSSLKLSLVESIAYKLAGTGDRGVDFRVVPSKPAFINGVSYVVGNETEDQALFDALKNGTPLPPYGRSSQAIPGPENVTLDVFNGTPTKGIGGQWAEKLHALGYKINRVENAKLRNYTKTWIVYAPGAELKAALLQKQFPGAIVRQSLQVKDADLWVVVGSEDIARLSPSPSPSSS